MGVKRIVVYHDLELEIGNLYRELVKHIGEHARDLCMLDVANDVIRWMLNLTPHRAQAIRSLVQYVPLETAYTLVDFFYRGVKRRLMPPIEFSRAKNQGRVNFHLDEDYSLGVFYTYYTATVTEGMIVRKGFRLFTEDLEETISLARFANMDRKGAYRVTNFISSLMNVLLNNPDVKDHTTLLEFAKLSSNHEEVDDNFATLFRGCVKEFREQAMQFHRDAIRQICRDEILDEQQLRELVVDFTVTDVICDVQHREYFVEIDCEYQR